MSGCWREALDPDVYAERLDILRESLLEGIALTEESASDIDPASKAEPRQAAAVIASMRTPDGVSTLLTRTFKCRLPSSQLRMNVESKVIMIADAAVSGLVPALPPRASPTFGVWRRNVS